VTGKPRAARDARTEFEVVVADGTRPPWPDAPSTGSRGRPVLGPRRADAAARGPLAQVGDDPRSLTALQRDLLRSTQGGGGGGGGEKGGGGGGRGRGRKKGGGRGGGGGGKGGGGGGGGGKRGGGGGGGGGAGGGGGGWGGGGEGGKKKKKRRVRPPAAWSRLRGPAPRCRRNQRRGGRRGPRPRLAPTSSTTRGAR